MFLLNVPGTTFITGATLRLFQSLEYTKYLESKLYVDQCVCLNIQTSLIRRENEEKSYHGSIDRPFMDSHFSKGASIAF